MNEIIHRQKQVSPRYELTREELRNLARQNNIPRGRNTSDTWINLMNAGIIEYKNQLIINTL